MGKSRRWWAVMALAAGWLSASGRGVAEEAQPLVSPDVPLTFVMTASGGGGPAVAMATAKWRVLLEFRKEIITDADGPRIRRLFREPVAGGARELIWDDTRTGPGELAENQNPPHVWVVYDDGAVLFSRGTQLNYVARPGQCRTWTPKVGDEECLVLYADTSGLMLWPTDFTKPREAWFVAGARDAFDLDKRQKVSGEVGLRYCEPLVKRHGDRLIWLDWPSYDAQDSTRYRLSSFDLKAGTGWSTEVMLKGNPVFEHFDGKLATVSGHRWDAGTGQAR